MPIDQLYFTRCASDKGREGIDGYQFKACSEGISSETEKRIRLFSQEYRWPTSLDPLVRPGPMAAEDFCKFPVSLHYYRVPDGRFGLTRICIAPIQPGRAGNFFAHTLVFPPEALEPVSYNPFAVARSDIFQQQDESSQTELPELNDFSEIPPLEDKNCWSVASAPPYSEYLTSMVDVLSNGQSGRPVIILPSSLQDAWGLVEAVLWLLPGKFRVGIEFSVYEPNPDRVMKAGLEDKYYGKKLITTSPLQEGGKFQFRPEQYAGTHYIFNFAELQFSKYPTPSAYVQQVAADCRGGRLQEVLRVQSWLGRLKLDTDPQKWSSILKAIDYVDPSEHRSKPEMRIAIDALVSTCRSSVQAEAAAATIVDLVETEAGVCPDSELRTAFSSLGMLIDRTDKPDRVKQDAARKLSETVASMLFAGRAICVQSASKTLGAPGRNLLGQAVERLVSKRSLAFQSGSTQHAATSADVEVLPEIMDQGLRALFEEADNRLRVKVLLPEALFFADKAGCLAVLWVRLKTWLMSEFLDTLPVNEAAELSGRIEAAVSGDKCPEARLDLLRWQLCSTSVPKDLKTSTLTNLAAACRASNNPPMVTKEILVEAVKQLDRLGYLFLLEALVGDGDDEVSQIVERAYNEYMVTVPEQDQWKLRRKMAGRNSNLVTREFVRTVWPWSEEQGQEKLDKWTQEIFERFPEVNNVVAKKLAALAARSQSGNAVASLLSAYLLRTTESKINQQGQGARAVVARSLIEMIPLGSMSPSLLQSLNNIQTENWPLHDVMRFDLMREMAYAREMYEANQEFSFAELLKQRPHLLELLKSKDLENTERQQTLEWAIEVALEGAGIDDIKSAKALFDIAMEQSLGESGSRVQTFVESLTKALHRTHPIKEILAVAQFALLAGAKIKNSTDISLYFTTPFYDDFAKMDNTVADATIWLAITLAKRMSNQNRKMLWGYLNERRRNTRWQTFLHELQAVTDGQWRTLVEKAAKGGKSLFQRMMPQDVTKQKEGVQNGPTAKGMTEEGWFNHILRIVRPKLQWRSKEKSDSGKSLNAQDRVEKLKSKVSEKSGKRR